MKKITSLLFSIFLFGCQTIPGNNADIAAQVDVLQHAKKYDSALDIIDHHEHPELFEAERAEVVSARDTYIDSQTALINASLNQHQWYKARVLIQESLKAAPTSEQLLALGTKANQMEQSFINEKLAIQSLAEGQYLINSIPTFEAITESVPDKLKYRRELSRMQQRSQQLANTLLDYAQVNFDNKNYQTAQDALDIAVQLNPESSAPELEEQLAQYWKKKSQRERADSAKKRQATLQAIEKQLTAALDAADLLKAQKLMARLWDMDANNPIRFEQQRHLNEALANRIETGLRRGDQLYNDGNLVDALTIWNSLLPLQPGHVGLNERISRAERFIANLERLQIESETAAETETTKTIAQ